MGQGIGIFAGLIAAFVITFIFLLFGQYVPPDVVHPDIVNDFLSYSDLELKLAIVSTVLFPTSLTTVNLGTYVGYGAQGGTVLTYLAWGCAGLVAGLLTRDVVQGVMSGVFSVIVAAFLTWLLIFFIATSDPTAIVGSESLLLLEMVLSSSLYPIIAGVIGGLLGGAISRER